MISIITPAHTTRYLRAAHGALAEQTEKDWEWVILLNGEARPDVVTAYLEADARVKLFQASSLCYVARPEGGLRPSIGALKREACTHAKGEIVVELDHDDMLMPRALEQIKEAFDARPEVDFVFGNAAYVDEEWIRKSEWPAEQGWRYREREAFGHPVWEIRAPAPTPQHLSRIWYAPDHPRAWRAVAYWDIGGHNPALAVTDDHDLMCRFYLQKELFHIDDLLYVYFVHGGNTWLDLNAEIQARHWDNHHAYIERMAAVWSDRNGLKKLDLGSQFGKPDGWTGVDKFALTENGDVRADLDKKWPFKDNSVGVIRAWDIFEHLKNKIHVLEECYRVLAHGGFLLCLVPSTDGRGADMDPTHVSRWNQNSFFYATRESSQKYVRHAGARCRFQELMLRTFHPNDWCRENHILYTEAHLVALKEPEPIFHGPVYI